MIYFCGAPVYVSPALEATPSPTTNSLENPLSCYCSIKVK